MLLSTQGVLKQHTRCAKTAHKVCFLVADPTVTHKGVPQNTQRCAEQNTVYAKGVLLIVTHPCYNTLLEKG